ncbi:transcription-repair coupling factor [Trichloromonas acetexigens]|uniref:Transcription-repair-coupling factor n=1 Tax=Trichloromonas acetexigens TaxID=38815 RepID=A0A550JFK0_9BACT|nr:transcription-repair coupling factor [Desulfuromonas acetexigens]TRO81981.1 transcription-repair coupling factor [Desulfuromonas acetexigens]
MDQSPQAPEVAHATIRSVLDGLSAGATRLEVLGLLGSSGAYLLAAELATLAEPLLVVAADGREAERCAAALAFYHGRPDEVFFFPHWEIRPYEPLSPHPEVEASRLAALAALHEGRARAVVTTARALLQRVIPREVLGTLSASLRAGEDYARNELTALLLRLGYNAVPLVEDRGTFSLRGDILDIFPPSLPQPVRLEFFGDSLERLRPFDPVSQRSAGTELKELRLLPAREMVLTGEFLTTFSRRLKERCDLLGLPRTLREAVLEEAREGLLAPGRQFLLPLVHERLDSLFDYAPKGRWVILDPPAVEQAGDEFAAEVAEGVARQARREEPYVEATELYLTPAELERELTLRRRQDFSPLDVLRLDEGRQRYRLNVFGNGDIHGRLREAGGFAALAAQLRQWREAGWRTLLVCHQQGQAERLIDLLAPEGMHPDFDPTVSCKRLRPGDLVITLGELADGFRLPDEKLAVVTEEEIFGQRVRRRPRKDVRALLSSLAELKEGDYVVHADHGIGRYHGLLHLSMGPSEGDFLHLEYAGGDKLYLPVERIEKVQKYVGGEGQTPRLDKMGGGAWEKAKFKARAAVEELARELLKIYARRELSQGFAYSPPDRVFREFEAAFPYEETPDQLQAIQEVLADMESPRPVDRLVCGDVGYGKTEVAIRAAFRAALDGRQVAVLVPTTVLARQHWETFRERFKGYPVEVDMVSRFRSPAEMKQVLERAAAGQVDILIGTHRILQRDVRFKNLGLVIIDEEQRFGVSHKERLKKLRAEVDVITLTATPIPRTLHMSMMGMRDLSVIETPPVDRLAVRTYVTRFDDDLIREAILRELRRGGQVFFVHNQVKNIEAMAEFLRTLVPEAKIIVGHGQMGEKALEQVMVDFIEGKAQVLVCSTIIENGIDIPRANTIIINRADCFGLSQLYQLRGRVGRSRHRAYAYLLIPGEGSLTREARERLRVLQDLTELGAGFRVASHDLELRGAGDLLGARQAGQIAAIGFEMYTELLEETIDELKGLEREEKIDPEVRLGLSAFLPEKYLPDPNQRLVFYKQLAAAEAVEELYDLADELRDRYGELPEPATLLIEVMKLRVLMKRLKVEQAEYDGRQLLFAFHAGTPVPPEKILKLMDEPGKYRFSPDYRLSVRTGKLAAEEVLAAAKKELQQFL